MYFTNKKINSRLHIMQCKFSDRIQLWARQVAYKCPGKHQFDNNFTWTDGVHLDAGVRQFAGKFIGKHDVGRLGVLVRLKTVE